MDGKNWEAKKQRRKWDLLLIPSTCGYVLLCQVAMSDDEAEIRNFFRDRVMLIARPGVPAKTLLHQKINLEEGLKKREVVRMAGPRARFERQEAEVAERRRVGFAAATGGIDAICHGRMAVS
jgi:hypothetical protein